MLTQRQPRPSASQFVTTTLKGDVLRATLVGPAINERASQIILQQVTEAIQGAGSRLKALVLDMSQVTQISSIGLGMCIGLRSAAHAAGAGTFTVSLNRELSDLFRMMCVDRLITMTRDEEELAKILKR